jgi:hypothetical protein
VILFDGLDPQEIERLNDLIALKINADIDEGTDSDILETYDDRFPRWAVLSTPTKCARTFRELEVKALDYYHHISSVLERFILVRSIEDWIAYLEEPIPSSLRNSLDEEVAQAQREAQEARDLRRFMTIICPNPDLLYRVEPIINDSLEGGQLFREIGLSLESYVDILPPDITERLAAAGLISPSPFGQRDRVQHL